MSELNGNEHTNGEQPPTEAETQAFIQREADEVQREPLLDQEVEGMVDNIIGDEGHLISDADRAWLKQHALRILSATDQIEEYRTPLEGESVRVELRRYFQSCIDAILRRQYQLLEGYDQDFERELRTLRISVARSRQMRTPEEEVKAYEGDFRHCVTHWKGVEFDALIAVLERGEKITKVMNDKIVTDKREIDRYSLREIRPPGIQLPRFIEQWERQFPARDEIERAVRSEEAD